ncbi:2181_t:CDS:10 [Acaulospora colombiana]|uniref:2181_t:CDS:1 n=1 Tax=Acaulospora colombiana TaxID=27376 RepID=A0ACA9LKJ0_9GLOM|nr:2181_t:CDS:10 [Acaulospora colombiana]
MYMEVLVKVPIKQTMYWMDELNNNQALASSQIQDVIGRQDIPMTYKNINITDDAVQRNEENNGSNSSRSGRKPHNRSQNRHRYYSQNISPEVVNSHTPQITGSNSIPNNSELNPRHGRYGMSSRGRGTRVSSKEDQGATKDSALSRAKNDDNVVAESSLSNNSSKVQSPQRTRNIQPNDPGSGSQIISDKKGKRPETDRLESSISSRSNSNQNNSRNNNRSKKSLVFPGDIKDVRTSITHGLTTSTYECMICCEAIRPRDKTWFCGVCWAVFHLPCTQKWAQKSFEGAGFWRCPGCQNRSEIIPETFQLRCADTDYFVKRSCGAACNKLLGCGKHYCTQECHDGECSNCDIVELQKCYCGQSECEIKCGEGNVEYTIAQGCVTLFPRNYLAVKESHAPKRFLCVKTPVENFYLVVTRVQISVIKEIASHALSSYTSSVVAVALSSRKYVPKFCPSANVKQKQHRRRDIPQEEENDANHICSLLCGKLLKCGNHTCQLLCHKEGHCMPCLEASFEELSCHCGRTKVYPPISCGTKVPKCKYECTRIPPCGHAAVPHPCHTDEEPCPPCPYLVNDKTCMCGRSVVKNVPCHKTNVSCGKGKGVFRPAVSLVKVAVILAHIHATHLQATCNATSENPEEIKGRQLECNESCALVERNRKLASALELGDRINEGDLIKAIPEYEEDLLQYYSIHKDWAKNIENTLSDFLLKSNKPTLNFPPMKSTHRKFIHQLCVHYRLSSCSVDVEPFRSVIVKKQADSAVPPLLPSQVFSKQGKLSIIAPPSTTPEQPARKQKQPINALYLSELAVGSTEEELESALGSLFGKSKFHIKWVSGEDLVIIPSAGSIHMDELESLLMRVKQSVKDSLVSKGIAAWVELCWVNSKYEISWREKSKMLHGSNTFLRMVTPSSAPFSNTNPYDALVDLTDESHVGGPSQSYDVSTHDNNDVGKNSKQTSKDLIVNGDGIVDDWELLSDE